MSDAEWTSHPGVIWSSAKGRVVFERLENNLWDVHVERWTLHPTTGEFSGTWTEVTKSVQEWFND